MSDFIYKVRLKEELQRAGFNAFFGGVSFCAGVGSTNSPGDVAALIHHSGCELTNDLPIADRGRLKEALIKLGMDPEAARAIVAGA